MNYLKITRNDIANGPGVRVVLWVAGCDVHCPGCHNPQSWDYGAGEEFTKEALVSIINELSRPEVAGLTLSGGHPLAPNNVSEVERIVSTIKYLFPKKTIWLYTGYTWEYLINNLDKYGFVGMCDVVVDGAYKEELRDISLKFRGSSNQRVIDVKASLAKGSVVLYLE